MTDRAARIEAIRKYVIEGIRKYVEEMCKAGFPPPDDFMFLLAEVTRLEQEVAWLKGKRRRRRNQRIGRTG